MLANFINKEAGSLMRILLYLMLVNWWQIYNKIR